MCTPVIIKRWTEERTIGRSGAQLQGPDTGYYVESITGIDRLQSTDLNVQRDAFGMPSFDATCGTRCYDCWVENGWGGFANLEGLIDLDRWERCLSTFYWISFISSNFPSDWILNRRLSAQWWIIVKVSSIVWLCFSRARYGLISANNISLYGSDDVSDDSSEKIP